MATPNICTFNKNGYCKYQEVCRKQHENKMCENSSCDILRCRFRHPRPCKYYKRYKRCKFDPCAFLHIDNDEGFEKLKSDNQNMQCRITLLEEKLDKFLDTKNHDHQIINLENQIKEKDAMIVNIENKIQLLEEKIKNLEDNKIKKQIQKSFKCSQCNFETNSKHGLRIHTTKKHTLTGNETYPKVCDFCDDRFETFNDMKRHLKCHSYKEANYTCEDCEFISKHDLTMEVHLGKFHSEKIECGICGFETKDMENLDTHLSTCEMYKCGSCDDKFKLLADIKKHIQETHKRTYIFHLKMDRNDFAEFSDTRYWSDDV